MKSISKLSKIALVVGASLTLAACGSSEEPETLQITQEVPDTPPAPPPPPTGGGDGSGSGDDGSGDDGSDDGSDEDDGSGGAGGDDGSDDEGGDDGSDEGGDDGSDEGGDDGSDEGGDDGSDEGGDDGSDEGGDDGSDEGGDDGSDEGGDDGSDEGDGEPGQVLFEEDIAEDIAQSTPTDVNIPLGIQATLDVEYLGAFRALADGESFSDYAVGTLGYNESNNSLYMVGYAPDSAIAEFKIPEEYSLEDSPEEIIIADVLQDYVKVLDKKDVGNENDRITGLLHFNDSLLVSSEVWYDAPGQNKDNLQVFDNASSLTSSPFEGMLRIEGEAKAAGYMSKIPLELQEILGGEYLVGWSTNYSISSRYSQGPSLYIFNPQDAIDAVPTVDLSIPTTPKMVFPFEEGKHLVEGSSEFSMDISPMWGPLSRAKYGFIIPGTSLFMAVGSNGGIHSGVGYKIIQDTGRECGGPCSYEYNDNYNYFWLFDITEIVESETPWSVRPISYGKWSHPFDNGGTRALLGAVFDHNSETLYISIDEAGQVGAYDAVPLILAYKVSAQP